MERSEQTVVSTRTMLDLQARKAQTPIVDIQESMVLDGEAKYITVDMNHRVPMNGTDKLEFMHLTDLQYGSDTFQEERFIEFRDWIVGRPNCFVFLGGDLIDAATPISIANPYTNTMEPSKQVMHLVELLQPLQNRILGSVGGNHERRTAKTFGDAGRLIATLLKIPYSRGVQHIDIIYGKHTPFKISLWHGSGAGRTKGAKAMMVHRFMQQADSQVYLTGHLHDVVVLYDWRQSRTPDRRIKLTKIAGIMSSSFQGYWNSYAESFGLSPSDTMMARIILEPSGHWEVTLR